MGVRFIAAGLGGVGLLVLALTSSGCSETRNGETATTAATNSPVAGKQPQSYLARGVIKEFRPESKEVVIRHEEIANYMPAMTMPFPVKDTNQFAGLSTNDQVTFTMIVTDKEGWIENLKKVGTDVTSIPGTARPAVRRVRDVEPLKIGDKMSSYTFTNSFGKKVSFGDFPGQAYAVTFIFTRCPFPNFCPRMSSNFSDAYQQLMAKTNGPTNWHLFSISFDPDFDTPERLREYSATYHPDPKKWDWVTGAMIDIDALADQLELVFAPEGATFNHNLRTAVVDKSGHLRKIFRGNEWKPEDLVNELVAGAEGQPLPKEE